MSFQKLYQEMFKAKQEGNVILADQLLIRMEELRKQEHAIPSKDLVRSILPLLPAYPLNVLGKNQTEVCNSERSNCINAAFNFFENSPRNKPYKTLEFLERIKSDYVQIPTDFQFRLGDLVVIWSRTSGAWDDQKIDVHQMNKEDADFPYGLVFDHVMVRLTEELVFHKPDPTLESKYQIDFFNSVVVPNSTNKGFELTFHRLAPTDNRELW